MDYKDQEIEEYINYTDLELAALNFFPKEGNWSSSCFNKSRVLVKNNLPCHLRNNEWLAKMLIKDQNLNSYSYEEVLNFVENSELFNMLRASYEQEIVKWQINYMKKGGEGWLCDEKYGGEMVFLSPICDIGFRDGIVKTLTSIGMNRYAIEEGIEKYSSIWRDFFMEQAFNNEFDPVFCYFDELDSKPDPEHKKNWLKMRKYEYYQNNKESVDKYGIVEPDMIMSEKELIDLKSYLKDKNNERLEYIEKSKKSNLSQPKQRIKIKKISFKK